MIAIALGSSDVHHLEHLAHPTANMSPNKIPRIPPLRIPAMIFIKAVRISIVSSSRILDNKLSLGLPTKKWPKPQAYPTTQLTKWVRC